MPSNEFCGIYRKACGNLTIKGWNMTYKGEEKEPLMNMILVEYSKKSEDVKLITLARCIDSFNHWGSFQVTTTSCIF